MQVFTLEGFAAHLAEMAILMPTAEHIALERAAIIIETEAKSYIGFEHGWWPPLAESTLANKAANTPLLETGEMRDSIEHMVAGQEAHIGSNNMKAVWQELGTSRGIPPRSFLLHAAVEKGPDVAHEIGRTMTGFLSTGTITWGAPASKAGLLRTLGMPTTFSQAPKVHTRF
jgi:hypothetical protein